MKLELKHLAGYLGAGLKIMRPDNRTILELGGLQGSLLIFSEGGYGQIGNSGNKPILHPLSDLTKEIEVNGEKFVPLYRLIKEDKAFTTDFINTFGYEELKVSVYELLLEWHFDIYGLIENNLAIDKNTIL